jgi:hypothetical protein
VDLIDTPFQAFERLTGSFSYLNFAKNMDLTTTMVQPNQLVTSLIEINILMDGDKMISKRVVYSFLAMFGDVGGVYGIFMLIMQGWNSFVTDSLFKMDLIKNLFLYHQAKKKKEDIFSIRKKKKKQPEQQKIQHFKFTCLEVTSLVWPCLSCLQDRKSHKKIKLMDKGIKRIDKVLDVESLMASHDILRQLLKLLLSPY